MITIDTNIVVRYLIKDNEIFVGRVSDSVIRHNISRLSGYGYRLTRPTNY
jgi:predicted nucleic-acid-binding protein